MHDFEKYDELDAGEANKFLAEIDDPDLLRAYVQHEKQNKDRSSVLTDAVINAALEPSSGDGGEPLPVEVPEGVTPGETPGWPVDEEENPISLPTSVRDEIANLSAELERLRGEVEGGDEVTSDDELTRETIAALLEERRGYEQRGETEKVKDVDAELKRLGHKGKKPADRATTR